MVVEIAREEKPMKLKTTHLSSEYIMHNNKLESKANHFAYWAKLFSFMITTELAKPAHEATGNKMRAK